MPYNKAAAHDEERASVKDSLMEEYCRDSAKDGPDMQQDLPQELFGNNKDYAKHSNYYWTCTLHSQCPFHPQGIWLKLRYN